MLRSTFIYLSKASWARRIVTRWPIAWRAASRFIAGETLDAALAAVKTLNHRGIHCTLDHLGEHTSTKDGARQATENIIEALNGISTAGLSANVSIKLTQIGIDLDEELCAQNLERIAGRAAELGNFIRIDMEDAPWVDATLGMYRRVAEKYGHQNLGVVIQAYLFRSEADIRALNASCTPVRLCKGAYKEPAEIAYPRKADVDANYDRLARSLMENALENGCRAVSADGRFPPFAALATHDDRRIAYARELAERIKLPQAALEFQMLYGIRRDLQEDLAAAGYPVRVYVPYGSEWYPYFTRRLAERPANVWFFISNFFRR